MNFNVNEKNGIKIVEIDSDKMTSEESDEFKSYMSSEVPDESKIVLDLNKVEFVDSTFLGIIVSILKRVSSAGGDITVANLNSSVQSIFEVTRLYKVFDVFDNIEKAVERMK